MRRVDEILEAWARGVVLLSNDEQDSVDRLLEAIAAARMRARQVPATLDRHALSLVLTKLDESEHWAHTLIRLAGARKCRPDEEFREQ